MNNRCHCKDCLYNKKACEQQEWEALKASGMGPDTPTCAILMFECSEDLPVKVQGDEWCSKGFRRDTPIEDESRNEIVYAKYLPEIDEHDYMKLETILRDGSRKTFHHHMNNPMPAEYIIIGHTWEELTGIAEGMFRYALGGKEIHYGKKPDNAQETPSPKDRL